MKYYADATHLNRLVADPSADIREVVEEVERLCDREALAATYYQERPDLLFEGHPWAIFVNGEEMTVTSG